MRKSLPIDNRKHEQTISDLGAYDYERASSAKHGLFYELLMQSWGERFSEMFLDYGCGPGFVSGSISSLGKQVVAFDISRKMVEIAKKRYDVPVLVADALCMPFKEAAFSTICISGVLHHILDLDKAR